MFKNVCITCYYGTNNLRPVFEICNNRGIFLAEMLMECCQVQINYDNNWMICESCLKVLHICYDFKKKCQETQEVLFNLCQSDIKYEVNDETNENNFNDNTSDIQNLVETKLEVKFENNVENNNLEKHSNELLNGTSYSKKNEYDCPKCDKKFRFKHLFKNHMLVMHSNNKPRIPCSKCKKVFTLPANLKRHTLLVHENKKPYNCQNCYRKFSTMVNFKSHLENTCKKVEKIKTNRSGKLPGPKRTLNKEIPTFRSKIPCPICDQHFYKNDALNEHILQHSDPSTTKYSCENCEMVFVSESAFKFHKGKKHNIVEEDKIKQMLCSFCGKTYGDIRQLREHLCTHTKDGLHKCQFCGKQFVYYSTYWLHVRIHTNNKKWKCNYCERTFIQKQHLTSHLRQHTGEKPFSCDLCGRNFSQKTNRDAHRRTHTGEKPYACNVCEEKFYDAGRLSKHKKKVHG